jgi:thiol-disulfide isomerase/thioredoxin
MLKSIARAGLIAAILGCFCSTSSAQEPGFTTADGQVVSLSSLRGKVVVMLFSGIQDPQCREGVKALEQLSERYQGKNVSVYWVSINSPAEMSDQQLKQPCGAATSVVTVRDRNQAAFKRFAGKVTQLPTIVVLDQQSQPHGQPRGGFNPNSDFLNDLSAIIDSFLQKK